MDKKKNFVSARLGDSPGDDLIRKALEYAGGTPTKKLLMGGAILLMEGNLDRAIHEYLHEEAPNNNEALPEVRDSTSPKELKPQPSTDPEPAKLDPMLRASKDLLG